MTESDPRGTSPADFAELPLAVLVPRYVARRLDGDTQTRPRGAIPRRRVEPPVSGAAIAGRALDAATPVEAGPRPGPSAGVIGAGTG